MAKGIDPAKLTQFSIEALKKVGVPEADAKITAEILVAADLRGVDSHGVAHLQPFYIKAIQEGRTNPTPNIKMMSHSDTTALMDGDEGLGFVVSHRAMSEAMKRAKAHGIGMVSVTNSNHYGAGAYYAMMALKENMIGLSLTQGGRGVVAPNTKGSGIGLNVLSVAVPSGNGAPWVLDMATGVVAGGKLEIARREGTSIPEGWALDESGKPTTDPHNAKGGILPLGGDPAHGAFKGFGLTMFIDILCGILSGTPSIPEKTGGRGVRSPGGTGHFFGAINIEGFMPAGTFKAGMERMVEALHNLPKADGVDRLYVNGEMEAEIEATRSKEGIPLHESIIQNLKDTAKELGLEYNL
jgi:LDH2 family malate/lactate/ureidoglycolate dehydrogenase